jgi:hypothetical protein
METRTLLTVIALMLAGIVTIMLVRAESDDVVSIFSDNHFSNNHNYENHNHELPIN